ncbi:MAG TPA: tripartite tricarboxylate transporter TctB family protein [Hyphomicrobiaceae bacterium]|nr:tripartite tricarboxylate transporter TctB family protein [Hyphomicrobiaceae bacterium]
MRIGDYAPAVFILALSALVLVGVWDLAYWSGTAPGPAFLPYWLVAVGLVLSIFGIAEARSSRENGPLWPNRPALVRVVATFAGLITIPTLSPVLGMVPVVMLFITFLLVAVLRRPLLPSILTVAVTGGAIYTIFVWWLGVALPAGPLGF